MNWRPFAVRGDSLLHGFGFLISWATNAAEVEAAVAPLKQRVAALEAQLKARK